MRSADEPVLLEDGVLERQVVAPVDQQLVLQVLRRVEVLARRLVAVTPALKQETREKNLLIYGVLSHSCKNCIGPLRHFLCLLAGMPDIFKVL